MIGLSSSTQRRKLQIKLLPHQWDFLHSDKKFCLLSGGIGSGKSYIGAHYVLKRVVENPKALHFIGANTAAQLRNSTLAAMFSVLQEASVAFSYNQNKGMLEFAGGKVLCASMENYNAHRGIEISTFWLDEVRDLRKEAFDMIMGRLRGKGAKQLQGRLTTSPNGFDWLYDYFHPNGELNTIEFDMIQAKSQDNRHLPEGYIETLRAQYGESLYKQEVLGEFINITSGKVYYSFNREKNAIAVKKLPGTIYVGCDFNIDPLCAVIIQFVNGEIHVLDEIFLRDSNTYELAHNLNKLGLSGATIIPDSTGKNRKTSGKSDFIILEEAGFRIQSVRNPLVFDRVNNVNRLLEQGRIKINPSCKKLVNDLEKVSWKGRELDQRTDPLLTHISDALGYAAWQLLPIQEDLRNTAIRIM